MQIVFTDTRVGVLAEKLAANVAHARSLGLPYLAASSAERGPLNVVGRGPSVAHYADEIRRRRHDTWAVGSAFKWCRDNGIAATALCVDTAPEMAEHIVGAPRAIVSDQCDPAVFAALRDADVVLIDPDNHAHGSTAATMTPDLGLVTGHNEIRFFGCESSFADTTHAGPAEDVRHVVHLLRVECGGRLFLTNPQMLLQAREMWELFVLHPEIFIDRSGGLLGAMIAAKGVHDVVAASPEFHASLTIPVSVDVIGGSEYWSEQRGIAL